MYSISSVLCLFALSLTPEGVLQEVISARASKPPFRLELSCHQAYGHLKGDYTDWNTIISFRNGMYDVERLEKRVSAEGATLHGSGRIIWTGKQFQSLVLPENGSPKGILKHSGAEELPWRSRAPYLFGILDSERQPFPEKMLSMSNLEIKSQREMVEGFECILLTARDSGHEYTVWLDPVADFALRKANVIQRFQPAIETAEGRKLTELVFDVYDVKIDVFDTVPVITSMKQKVQNSYVDGTIETDEHWADLTSLEWNPDFEAHGSFTMEWPADITVTDLDTGMRYGVSASGELSPSIDTRVIDEIDSFTARLGEEPSAGTSRIPSPNIVTDSQVPPSAEVRNQSAFDRYGIRWSYIAFPLVAVSALFWVRRKKHE